MIWGWAALIVLTFLTGIIVKYVDVLEDNMRKSPLLLRITMGLFYGFLLYYTISRFSAVASLWIGAVIGLILAKKIDAPGHYAGVGLFLTLLVLFGFTNVNFVLLLLFAAVCVIEEILNDYSDKKRIGNKILSKIISARPLLEIAALTVSMITGAWIIWIALLGFDFGYILITKFAGNIKHYS